MQDHHIQRPNLNAWRHTFNCHNERSYRSGTSQVKLYVPSLVAMKAHGCELNLVDYVPCHRTKPGTGEGFAFMCRTSGAA